MKKLLLTFIILLMTTHSFAKSIRCINSKDETKSFKVFEKSKDNWCVSEFWAKKDYCKKQYNDSDKIVINYLINDLIDPLTKKKDEILKAKGRWLKINRYSGVFEDFTYYNYHDETIDTKKYTEKGKCIEDKKLF